MKKDAQSDLFDSASRIKFTPPAKKTAQLIFSHRLKCMRLHSAKLFAQFDRGPKGDHSAKHPNKPITRFSKSDGDHSDQFIEIVMEANRCCNNQEFHLLPIKAFLLKHHLTLKHICNWKLSECILAEKYLKDYVKRMKDSDPAITKHHLFSLLENVDEKELNLREIEKEEKILEDRFKLWQNKSEGTQFKVTSISE